MRVLHTADLHLAEDAPETIEALDVVLETATDEGVDLLTIGGDVFDSPEDASRLRTEVRNRCSGLPFDIVAIPGNHDADVFEREFDLGTDLTVLRETPCGHVAFGDVSVVGVPFTRRMTSDVFAALQDTAPDRSVRVLLVHCTLDLGFGRNAAGDDEVERYFPVELATLGRLDYEFVLAGHVHVRFETEQLDTGGTFVYPGSPVSHSWTELGPRYAALVDTDTGGVERVELETPYLDRRELTVTPENQDAIPDEIATWVADHPPDRSTLEVVVRGYVDGDERAYNDELREAAGAADATIEVESVTSVLEHEIYREAMDRLDDAVLEEYDRATPEDVERLLVNELAPLLDTGEVR